MNDAAVNVCADLLREANFDDWESVTSALKGARGQVPPRVAWLTLHLAETKRAYWALISAVAGTPMPPEEADLNELMRWEVGVAQELNAEQLGETVEYSGRTLTVLQLVRLNARHSAWHAGQIAALSNQRFA